MEVDAGIAQFVFDGCYHKLFRRIAHGLSEPGCTGDADGLSATFDL